MSCPDADRIQYVLLRHAFADFVAHRPVRRKPVFGFGHLTFAALTLYLATTLSLSGFMVGRCFQGMAQGTFFVCAVATVLTLFPLKLRGVAFSFFRLPRSQGRRPGHSSAAGLSIMRIGVTHLRCMLYSPPSRA